MSQSHPAATEQKTFISRACVAAMHNRAKQLVLTQAWLGKPDGLKFAQGLLNGTGSLLDAKGAEFCAARDESFGGYQPLAGFETAWACLPVGVERFTLAQVQEFLRSHGVEIPADAISDSQINVVIQFKDNVLPVIDGDDGHDAALTNFNNSASLHLASNGDADIVQEGGAA